MSNWERLVWNQRDALLSGLGVTLEICFLAFAGAIVGGLILCLGRLYVAPLRPLAVLLIEFFRATPIFVQLMWVNYVWPEIFGWPNTFFTAGWGGLALQSGGYLAEPFPPESRPCRARTEKRRWRWVCRMSRFSGVSCCRRRCSPPRPRSSTSSRSS